MCLKGSTMDFVSIGFAIALLGLCMLAVPKLLEGVLILENIPYESTFIARASLGGTIVAISGLVFILWGLLQASLAVIFPTGLVEATLY